MTSQPIWAKHYQRVWEERSGDPQMPQWLRVASLAYGKHKANGHAQFRRGQIALVLATVDPQTGEVLPDLNVGRAIRRAVQYGWLAEGSNVRCLIVPSHAISGPMGNQYAPCPDHGEAR